MSLTSPFSRREQLRQQGQQLLTLGIFDPSIVGHVAYLVVMGLIGATIASRRLDGLLRK